MIYATPRPTREVRRLLAELDDVRDRLAAQVGRPGQWVGQLRRTFRAESVAGSVGIEGFTVSDAEAFDLVDRLKFVEPGDEHRVAVASYAHAMRHVDTLADDPSFAWDERVLLDLHFDACFWQEDRRPGRWRTTPIGVTRDGGGLAFEGPPAEDVPGLMREVVAWLASGADGAHPVIRAAMTHLHLVSVRPFEDGNGRLARIAQSLVLARDGLLAPELASIEQYLGTHTRAYYDALTAVQAGGYHPDRDASRWVSFCIHAHLEQGRARLRRIDEAADRWDRLEQLAEERGWPDRLVIALEQSLFDATDRARYAAEADVSTATASADLRRLADAGLVEPHGRGRNVRYGASDALRERLARD